LTFLDRPIDEGLLFAVDRSKAAGPLSAQVGHSQPHARTTGIGTSATMNEGQSLSALPR
jgi:hypothetical protein